MTLSITMLCHYTECHILFTIMLNIIILSVIMLSVIALQTWNHDILSAGHAVNGEFSDETCFLINYILQPLRHFT